MPRLLSDRVNTQIEKLQNVDHAPGRYNSNDIERICNHAVEVFKDCVNEFAKNAIVILETKGPGYLQGADDFTDKIKIGLDKAFTLKSKFLNEINRSIRYIPRKYIEGVVAINNIVKEFAITFQSGNIDEKKFKSLKEKLKGFLPNCPIDGDNAEDPEKIVYQHFYDWLLNTKINHIICHESLEDSSLILVDNKFINVKAINEAKVSIFNENVNNFIETINKLEPESQDMKVIENDLRSLNDTLTKLNKSCLGLVSVVEKMMEANSNDVNVQLHGLQDILQSYDFPKCSKLFEYAENYLSSLSSDQGLKSLFELINKLAVYVNEMANDFNRFEQIKGLIFQIQEDPASITEEIIDNLRDAEYSAGIDEALDICQSVSEITRHQTYGMSR